MKKYVFTISVLLCFLAAVAGTGSCTVQQQASVPGEKNIFTFLAADYPHTEFELKDHTVSVNNTGRQQVAQNFIATPEYSDRSFHDDPGQDHKDLSNISAKKYLSHIYPSHNFW